jgi:hypothetical protein
MAAARPHRDVVAVQAGLRLDDGLRRRRAAPWLGVASTALSGEEAKLVGWLVLSTYKVAAITVKGEGLVVGERS